MLPSAPHRTLALEHEPIDCEDEIVEPEGNYEDLVDVENSLLQGDSHLRVVRCLLSNPVASEEWKRTTIFYTLARSGDTLMKLVIDWEAPRMLWRSLILSIVT